jgi:hypothetical protein
LSPDGSTARCERVRNEQARGQDPGLDKLNELYKGNGGYHRINGAAPRATSYNQAPRPAPSSSRRNDLHILARKFATAISPRRLDLLARELGLSVQSLKRLDVGWCDGERMLTSSGDWRKIFAWSFPMRDASDNIVGLRMRAERPRSDGSTAKFSFTGGSGGLFIPHDLAGGRVYLVEGPTDTAAALDMGLNAFGRESCSAGVSLIIELIKKFRFAQFVIFSQRDEAKPRDKRRPELGMFWPAQEGAERLAKILHLHCPDVRAIMPPVGVKDVRIWRQLGATAADVERQLNSAPPRRLTIKRPVGMLEGASTK